MCLILHYLQIKEIFELFDTDGGGTIDRRELEFAMIAMGFHSESQSKRTGGSEDAMIDAIAGDGTVCHLVSMHSSSSIK